MKTSCNKCGSSDAVEVYEDHDFCFSCSTYNPNMKDTNIEYDTDTTTYSDICNYPQYPINSRGISLDVVKHFGVRMSVDTHGKPSSHYYPYTKGYDTCAYKERRLPKSFYTHGNFKDVDLFGQRECTGRKVLVITEGEIDCLSIAQAWWETSRRIYSVVALPSASAKSTILGNREWINSFDKVVLMLDNDEAGKNIEDFLGKVIKVNRCYIATLPEKDANETLMKHGAHKIVRAVYDARPWSPSGILRGESIWDKYKERKEAVSVPYPPCLSGLNRKLDGIRQGEITLFTSGTGSGKSTVIKEIILNLLSSTEDKIGLISLEESIGDTAEKFIGMALQRSLSTPTPPDETMIREGFEQVFKDERLILLDHQGSVSDTSLTDKMEYMALMGCKYIILDHITIAVSEGSEGLSGNEAVDKLMSDLLKITKRHNIWLGLISHLRKASHSKPFEEGYIPSIDDVKGSGSIKQIAFEIVAFARNLIAEDEYERNTIKLRVLKSRFTGRTGDAGAAIYDASTTRLKATDSLNFEIL